MLVRWNGTRLPCESFHAFLVPLSAEGPPISGLRKRRTSIIGAQNGIDCGGNGCYRLSLVAFNKTRSCVRRISHRMEIYFRWIAFYLQLYRTNRLQRATVPVIMFFSFSPLSPFSAFAHSVFSSSSHRLFYPANSGLCRFTFSRFIAAKLIRSHIRSLIDVDRR